MKYTSWHRIKVGFDDEEAGSAVYRNDVYFAELSKSDKLTVYIVLTLIDSTMVINAEWHGFAVSRVYC